MAAWSLAQWSIVVFGACALLMGAVGLLWPAALSQQLGGTGEEVAFVVAASMASFNMGAYYLLAARQGIRPFFRWTVPFRCLTAFLFAVNILAQTMPPPFWGVALWELAGALLTGAALWSERRAT